MPKRKCLFSEALVAKYPCFVQGRSDAEALCTICKAGSFVSIANKGAGDLSAHLETVKHRNAVKSGCQSQLSGSMSTFVAHGTDIMKSKLTLAAESTLNSSKRYFRIPKLSRKPIGPEQRQKLS